MTIAVCDTSVVAKWFLDDNESAVPEARAIRAAAASGALQLHALELVLYELGNAMLRRTNLKAPEIGDRLHALQLAVTSIHALGQALAAAAARLARQRALTYYDGAHLALALALDAPLVSADSALIDAGAITTGAFAATLR
jgi:predicted nucleic acid-binding protein